MCLRCHSSTSPGVWHRPEVAPQSASSPETQWASYSGCAEVSCTIVATWVKSSYSDNNGGNCVEIAPGFPTVVPVRDSKTSEGPVLLVTHAAWSAFTSALRSS